MAKAALPDGWEAVPSQSRPGQFSYVNSYTGEKIAWKPDIAAVPEVSLRLSIILIDHES